MSIAPNFLDKKRLSSFVLRNEQSTESGGTTNGREKRQLPELPLKNLRTVANQTAALPSGKAFKVRDFPVANVARFLARRFGAQS